MVCKWKWKVFLVSSDVQDRASNILGKKYYSKTIIQLLAKMYETVFLIIYGNEFDILQTQKY